jgi:hypothetical protein
MVQFLKGGLHSILFCSAEKPERGEGASDHNLVINHNVRNSPNLMKDDAFAYSRRQLE